MKILVICDHFFPEEFIINDLVKEWSITGHDIHVITPNPAYPKGIVYPEYKNRIFQITYWDKITIHRVFTVQGFHRSLAKKILNYLAFPVLGTIRAICLARKFDRIFVYQVGPLTQAIPAVIAHKLYKKKVVLWSFDIWPDTVFAYGFKQTRVLAFLLNKLVKFIYRNCDSILVPSEGFKGVYAKYTDEKKLIYAPSWCMQGNPVTPTGFSFDGEPQSPADKSNFETLSSSKFESLDKTNSTSSQKTNSTLWGKINSAFTRKTNFTFAGNIGKVQNLANVMLGFELAVQSNKEIALHIVGDGSFLEGLQQLVHEKEIPNVVFWGRQPYVDMDKYYEASDFLIISLDPDPVYDLYIPAKFQSYLQTGKPILSIMNGQIPALINQFDIGIVAAPENIADIAEKMIQCTLMTMEARQRIKLNAERLLETNFDRMKIIDTITKELIKN